MTESPMKLGKNRTGCGLMGERKMQAPPVAEADLDLGTLAAGNLTQKFQQQAPAIGSIPPPDTAKGRLGAAVQAIKGNKLHVYVDKLGERLAFERGGVRLYDALLSKYDSARTNGEHLPPRDAIEAIREEELEHFRMLHDTIKDLGADPAAVTPSADLVGVQALGLMQVVADPRVRFTESLMALLTAERTDTACWQLLVQLAQSLGQEEAARRFNEALQTELRHETLIYNWIGNSVTEQLKVA